MKPLFFSTIVSGAMLLSVVSFGQYKYTPRVRQEKKENNRNYQITGSNPASNPKHTSDVSVPKDRNRNPIISSQQDHKQNTATKNSSIINDPIDIYAENPVLLKATLRIYFGNLNVPSGFLAFDLFDDPYYDHHTASYYIQINHAIDSTKFYPNTTYDIPVYTNSDNHWTVTYADFVTKWVDATHTHSDFNTWKTRHGGKVAILIPTSTASGNINKLMLILQFAGGTKTIVWDTPITLSWPYTYFSFDQNFNVMNGS